MLAEVTTLSYLGGERGGSPRGDGGGEEAKWRGRFQAGFAVPPGLQTRLLLTRTLGIFLGEGRMGGTGPTALKKYKLKDPPQAGCGKLPPAPTLTPFPNPGEGLLTADRERGETQAHGMQRLGLQPPPVWLKICRGGDFRVRLKNNIR